MIAGRRYVPFVLGICVILPLAGGLVRSQYELRLQTSRAQVRDALDSVADRVSAVLDRGVAELQTPLGATDTVGPARGHAGRGVWRPWTLDGNVVLYAAGSSDLQVAAGTLQRALDKRASSAQSPLLLGPFATASGANALVIATRVATTRSPTQWRGVTALVEDVIPVSSVRQFASRGNRLQVIDSGSASAIFQTEEGDVPSPVVRSIPFAQTRWELRAAPHAGWSAPIAHLSGSVFVILAVLTWLSFEVRRDKLLNSLGHELALAEDRRKKVNALYGQSLQSLAEIEGRLNIASMYDSVTGLANRGSLLRRIDAALDTLRQYGSGNVGLLSVGFEQFRYISNTFGAEFASRLLVIAAERLEFVLPSKDLLFRTGDYQLAIVLPASDGPDCEALARKVIAELDSPIALDNHTFLLRPSVGIVGVQSGYEYAESLLDQSNTALSLVQRDSASRICFFDSSTVKDSVTRLQLEADLGQAFAESQFELEYQPVVGTASRQLVGFEALIRWNHPTEGRIPPSRFVPIAEQAGMAGRLNQWAMRDAARQAALWRQLGHSAFYINVNLTAGAFQSPHLIDEVSQLLAEFELDGRFLQVELTESALIEDLRAAARTVQKLSELGVRAWLDDFGTGYSSLSYLRTLPLKGVKIDRSFIERIVEDSRDFGLVRSLIDLIHYLGMDTVVEGIETEEQHALLRSTACTYCQGYFFSRSLPAQQAEAWLQNTSRLTLKAVCA